MIHHSSISAVYNEYSDNLFAYALHLGFNADIAMDAIHDVFYNLCINRKSLEDITNLKFYLFRALKNRLIDIQRNRKEKYAGIFVSNESICESMSFRLNVTIEEELIQEEDQMEIRRKIEEVLSGLTDRQREIIYLRYIHEYDYEEIAELMHISVASCRNLISKSINKLKDSALSLSQVGLIISILQQIS